MSISNHKDTTNNKEINNTNTNILFVSIENIFYTIVIILIIVIILSSIYYRYYINKYGQEPFKPPLQIPNFIYPRVSKDPLLRNTIENNLDKIFFSKSDSEISRK